LHGGKSRGWRGLSVPAVSSVAVVWSIQPLSATATELKVAHFVYGIGLHAIANGYFDVTGIASQIFAANYLTATKRQDVRRAKTGNRKKSYCGTKQHMVS